MKGVSKTFPGVRALDGVSLTLNGGSVHALMGENGAGKSTLMKCLFGEHRPDGGEILIDGRPTSFKSPSEALLGGVAMVHQELNQAEKLTVYENMFLGRFPRALGNLPFISKNKMRERTAEIFEELGVSTNPDAKIEELSVSERQMVEIARAVSYGARIIVFDEPTSSLTEREAEKLFKIIDTLKGRGCGIIYISHKMAEILQIADTVTVMRDGRLITTEPAVDMSTDKIIRLMVGRELTARYPERKSKPSELLFRAEELYGEYSHLSGASLTLRRGEILGIAGLEGSGRTELLEAIFGLSALRSGRLFLGEREIRNRNPREAVKNGFALLTEERRRGGIFGILDIKENTTVASLRRLSVGPFISEGRRLRMTKDSIKRLGVKTPSEKTKIRNLSGGNQQKVILARWLLTRPEVLLLDEPTRGIDVGAKYEIYSLLDALAAEGRGIIVVSSEMPELIGISDRIAVMSGGRIAGEVDPRSTTQEKIMELAAKHLE